jgi:hypothetical protein
MLKSNGSVQQTAGLPLNPGVVLAGLCRAVCGGLLAPSVRGQSSDSLQRLEKWSQNYQIQIVSSDLQFPGQIPTGTMDGEVADPTHLQDYASLFVEEFSL